VFDYIDLIDIPINVVERTIKRIIRRGRKLAALVPVVVEELHSLNAGRYAVRRLAELRRQDAQRTRQGS
jgi:hypothetical protein